MGVGRCKVYVLMYIRTYLTVCCRSALDGVYGSIRLSIPYR
nr:MAG TPA: hypothetical protein [Caudoviricetes sp.]